MFKFPWVAFIYKFHCSFISVFSVEVRTNMGWKSRQTDIELGWNQRRTPVFSRRKILKITSPWYLKELSTFVQFWGKKKSMTVFDRIENSTIKLYYVLHRIFLLKFYFFYRVYIQDLFTQKFIKESKIP